METNNARLPNWAYLTDVERTVLLQINPESESVINGMESHLFSESEFKPYTPVGTSREKQGVNMPWLPPVHVITHEKITHYTTVYHPTDSSYHKTEERRGINVIVRKRYFLYFEQMVKACMSSGLRALPWSIYEVSNGTPHLYLQCDGPGVNGSKGISLYVPYSYFSSHDWSEVDSFHRKVAVGYYSGNGFKVDEKQLSEWRDITASALVKPQAIELRNLVEGVIH